MYSCGDVNGLIFVNVTRVQIYTETPCALKMCKERQYTKEETTPALRVINNYSRCNVTKSLKDVSLHLALSATIHKDLLCL